MFRYKLCRSYSCDFKNQGAFTRTLKYLRCSAMFEGRVLKRHVQANIELRFLRTVTLLEHLRQISNR